MASTRGLTIALATASALTTGVAAYAAPMTEADSSTFSFKYEMDVDPKTLDLDGNGSVDWANHSGVTSFAGGVGTFASRMNGTGTSIWQSSGASSATSWTLEIRAKPVEGTVAKLRGYWGISTSNTDGNVDWFVDIDENAIAIRDTLAGVTTGQAFATESNSTDYVTIRIAQDAEGLWVWRGNVLLNPTTPGAATAISTAITNRLLIGVYGSNNAGNTMIDYVRLTSGQALAPVGQVIPEPASLALLALGAVLVRRKG